MEDAAPRQLGLGSVRKGAEQARSKPVNCIVWFSPRASVLNSCLDFPQGWAMIPENETTFPKLLFVMVLVTAKEKDTQNSPLALAVGPHC